MLFGLLRKQKFHFIHAYKEEAFATVKETVKEVSVTVMELLVPHVTVPKMRLV